MAQEGGEIVVINSQERAVSTDINRLQAFRARDVAEAFRHLLGINQGTDDQDAGALYNPQTATTTPLTAEVFAGLLVQPQLASLNLLVTQGVAHCIVPTATTDNSIFYFVEDPGVSVLGSLVMAPNAGGSARIDVVECQPADQVIESDSRNFFNPVTGLFSPITVTKATAARMTYRVRQGTVGGGWPGAASGWLPLCVASVPAGATSCDQITFWDVRPLTTDRVTIGNASLAHPRRVRGLLRAQSATTVSGIFEAVFKGRRVGGRLARGTPGTDTVGTLNLNDVANQDPGVASSALNVGTLCLAFPFSLPRWARYTDATSGARVPRSPRGIPVLTTTGFGNYGLPSTSITLPASLGFGGAVACADAVLAFGVPLNGGGSAQSQFFGEDDAGYAVATPTASLTMVPITNGATTTVAAGTHFPFTARSVRLAISITVTPGSTTSRIVQVLVGPDDDSTSVYIATEAAFVMTASVAQVVSFMVELPLVTPNYAAGNTGPGNYLVTIQSVVFGGSPDVYSFPAVNVLGWRF
jgi:hypothetical protein